MSHDQYASEFKQRLNNTQEKALIAQINRLTDCGIPLTARIVRNLAEEVIGSSVGKNWTSDFVRRHKNELKSLYLWNIDKKRMNSEYGPIFKQYFNLVSFNGSN